MKAWQKPNVTGLGVGFGEIWDKLTNQAIYVDASFAVVCFRISLDQGYLLRKVSCLFFSGRDAKQGRRLHSVTLHSLAPLMSQVFPEPG